MNPFKQIAAILILLSLAGTAGAATCPSIEQFGITWAFQAPYPECGQFVNGDWWVVGPVTVTSVSPATTTFNGSAINGSMVNPLDGYQGYDQRAPYYQANLTKTFPLPLQAGQSLVSTESWTASGDFPEPDELGVPQDLGKTKLRNAAVLTVVSQAPPADAFRPSYFGTDKTIYRESDLDYSKLPNLIPPQHVANPNYDFDDIGIRPYRGDPAVYPTVADTFARIIERPWIMHMPGYECDQFHPTNNQPNYYREAYDTMHRIAVLLCTDLDTIYSAGTRRKLVIPVVQLGIDSYYTFNGTGGERSKQIFPIIFTGYLLGNENFLGIEGTMVAKPKTYGEIYYRNEAQSTIQSATIPKTEFYNGTTVGWRGDPGTAQEYEHLDPGPEYNPVTGTHPMGGNQGEWDDIDALYPPEGHASSADKLEVYRRIISPRLVGIALAIDKMGLRDYWNHPAFFDYINRWMDFEGMSSLTTFTDIMWAEYGYGEPQECQNTDTSCGTYPGCVNCNASDGCVGTGYRDYSCSGTACIFTDTPNDSRCRPAQVPTDYAAYWKFNGNFLDETGNNNCTAIGASLANDSEKGGVVQFSGNNQYLSCGNHQSTNLTGNFSITAWIKPSTFGESNYARIIDRGTDAGTSAGYTLLLDGDNQNVGHIVYGNAETYSNNNSVSLGEWQHIALVYNGTTATFYKNGMAVGSRAYSTNAPSSANYPLVIGARDRDKNREFDGAIGETRIYNRALAAQEITAIHNYSGTECVDNAALLNYVSQWKQGNTTMPVLMQKITLWKAGTGC